MNKIAHSVEVASRLGLLHGSVRHYGLNGDVNSVLLMADIVLYVIAPDFPVLKKYVVDGVHTIFFPRHDPDALLKAFSHMISNGKLSKFARNSCLLWKTACYEPACIRIHNWFMQGFWRVH
ncbi:hypothetical protein M0R45_035466 [Rubus argutus]|uniref:Uncharacterized protein n=1 Tax=Rubus argutus TaxID=59490 RepID=A0AAW1VXM1_RUBAR